MVSGAFGFFIDAIEYAAENKRRDPIIVERWWSGEILAYLLAPSGIQNQITNRVGADHKMTWIA